MRQRRSPPFAGLDRGLTRIVEGNAIDTIAAVAADLLSLDVVLARSLEDEEREHVRAELAAARTKLLEATRALEKKRK